MVFDHDQNQLFMHVYILFLDFKVKDIAAIIVLISDTVGVLCTLGQFSCAVILLSYYSSVFVININFIYGKYTVLARAQKEHHEKKEKAKLARTQIDFVGGQAATKRSISAPATNTGIAILIYIMYMLSNSVY